MLDVLFRHLGTVFRVCAVIEWCAGTAVGLNLLFKIDQVSCILLTSLDVLALFLLVPQTAVRQAEQWTAGLVFAVLGCFIIDLFISQPPFGAVISGLVRSFYCFMKFFPI